MKAKIRAIFLALQNLERQRTEMIQKQVEGEPTSGYGQNFVVCEILMRALQNCELEIELPPISGAVLVPFLQDELLREVAKRLARKVG